MLSDFRWRIVAFMIKVHLVDITLENWFRDSGTSGRLQANSDDFFRFRLQYSVNVIEHRLGKDSIAYTLDR